MGTEMEIRTITDADKKKILALITALLPNVKVYLFGSYATGRARPGSDVDIALDAGCRLDTVLVGEVRDILEASNIPHRFDVSDFYRLPEDIQNAIRKEGLVWKS
jgi:predicted nucleotidyltransferase